MYFNEFSRKLSGDNIIEQSRSYGHLIEKLDDSTIYIDKKKTQFSSIEEARNYIKQKYYSNNIEEQVKTEIYVDLSYDKIADIINKHHKVKITDTLIESYVDLASSKLFTLDPVVYDLRRLNKLDTLIEGKQEYKLKDNSIVAINNSTYNELNRLFAAHSDVIDYMKETKQNFMKVLKQIGE